MRNNTLSHFLNILVSFAYHRRSSMLTVYSTVVVHQCWIQLMVSSLHYTNARCSLSSSTTPSSVKNQSSKSHRRFHGVLRKYYQLQRVSSINILQSTTYGSLKEIVRHLFKNFRQNQRYGSSKSTRRGDNHDGIKACNFCNQGKFKTIFSISQNVRFRVHSRSINVSIQLS